MKGVFLLFFFLIGHFVNNAQTEDHVDILPNSGSGNHGFRLWGESNLYKIHMGNTAEYQFGPVTGYSIKTNMQSDNGWGWTWGTAGLDALRDRSAEADKSSE